MTITFYIKFAKLFQNPFLQLRGQSGKWHHFGIQAMWSSFLQASEYVANIRNNLISNLSAKRLHRGNLYARLQYA